MFCPECRAEYRLGFTRCSDCEVDLVHELPAVRTDFNSGELKRVWSGKDQERCVSLCKQFKAAGIPFDVDQYRRQYFKGVDESYKITVPPEFFDRARKIITRGFDEDENPLSS